MTLIKTLFLMVILSSSIASYADEYSEVLAEIKALMTEGDLANAYRLALPYEYSDVRIDLKLAQMSMLMGREEKAFAIFERLSTTPETSELQKQNIQRFMAKFEKAQKGKVRQLTRMANAGECEQAFVLYQELSNYSSVQPDLRKAITPCLGIMDSFEWQARVSIASGYDDNVALSNEDFITRPQPVIEGHYQDATLRASAKIDPTSTLRISPEYSYFQRQYDTSIASKYDQSSHRLQLQFAGIIKPGLSWKFPLFYRYSQFADRHISDYSGFKFRLKNRTKQGSHRYSFAWQQKKYVDADDQYRNADITDLSYRYALNMDLYRLTAAVYARNLFRVLDESDSYNRGGIDIDISKTFFSIFNTDIHSSIYATYNQSISVYLAADPVLELKYGAAYGKAREDARNEWRIGARFNKSQWQLRTYYSQQFRDSNLDRYDFQRSKVEMAVMYQF